MFVFNTKELFLERGVIILVCVILGFTQTAITTTESNTKCNLDVYNFLTDMLKKISYCIPKWWHSIYTFIIWRIIKM